MHRRMPYAPMHTAFRGAYGLSATSRSPKPGGRRARASAASVVAQPLELVRQHLLFGRDTDDRERDLDPLGRVPRAKTLHELMLQQVLVGELLRAQVGRELDRPVAERVE